ncbi:MULTISPECIES: hypothetical protein [Bifidobacterium]|uniref:Growth inhibitor PemK n=1 Tax=Bifidobacterium callitrichidarum TaxID=2052941 RepID=A0A2U2N1N2_9BIFI|nr:MULTISPECIES: hypothetical protein [Bifidobacterium]MBT1169847.1 hypothetical protein [Bifidobacterium sp. SO4]PWG63020.1 hypothetical protein DF196_11385 [Bifidobacterium callitrichidarum]
MSDRPVLKPVPEILRTFDVYRMPVRFEEDKTRSRNHYVTCIVIDVDGDGGVAVKLTSNPKWEGAGDVQLLDWEQAGLTHVTTARCAQLVRFKRKDLQGYTGTLSREDAIRLVGALSSVPPDESIWL